ncbi:hypothetical protein Barb6_03726 [Bacteroidales bacterium Barb6]|nr:hypothetical protein Barb6_03726 [Bacteroidales bacterium Barb6]
MISSSDLPFCNSSRKNAVIPDKSWFDMFRYLSFNASAWSATCFARRKIRLAGAKIFQFLFLLAIINF